MKKYFVVIIALLILVFLSGVFLPRDFDSKKDMPFRIEKGQGSREIALNLEKDNLIWWGPIFRLYVLTLAMAGDLKAGTYFLSSSMNIPQIAEKFAKGDIAKAKITIPEGFTAEQIHQKLKNETGSDLVLLNEYEGYLFPDTYEINYGALVQEIIKMMTDNFNEKTANLKITPEIVIMASILEKELKTKEEKELAAGILWKRLKIGMPLQVDAFMWTYENLGLPAKPIANPGLASLESASFPKVSDYWYYLSAPDGQTIFSKTLQKHNIAKAKYLK